MAPKAPRFWWKTPGWKALSLWPLGKVYGRLAGRRMRRADPFAPAVPVICVGNFTLGGAGKTPTALALAGAAKAMGLTPGFLSRGYGGRLRGPTLVDPARHTATDVGDEPLLLAAVGPTVIARKRADGAKALVEAGVDLILMDDGFQSAQITVDLALIVVDAARGIGNGLIFPAGPLRAPIRQQLRAMTALLKVGPGDRADPLVRLAARAGKQVLLARLRPAPGTASLQGQRVLAFAGIAAPEKFHRTLEELGAEVVAKRNFGDHQRLGAAAMAALLAEAERRDLRLVTTQKDAVRLDRRLPEARALADRLTVIPVDMAFDDPDAPRRLIVQATDHFRRRTATLQRP